MMKILLTLCCFILFVPMTLAQTPTPTPPPPPAPPVPSLPLPIEPEGLDFVWWQDPNEGAFAIQIPQGWQTQGGMSDVFGVKQPVFSVISPDNANYIGFGSVPIEWGVLITPELESEGWSDGQSVTGETGMFIYFSQFVTGAKAAQILIDSRAGTNCESYEITEVNDFKREVIDGVIYSPGEAYFDCNLNEVMYSGYFYAVTIAYPLEGIGTVWTIDTVHIIFALPNNFEMMTDILRYMLETTRYNPAWVETLSEPNPDVYEVLSVQIADDTLLSGVVSQIIGLSYQRTQSIIAEHNAMVDLDYEFLPLP